MIQVLIGYVRGKKNSRAIQLRTSFVRLAQTRALREKALCPVLRTFVPEYVLDVEFTSLHTPRSDQIAQAI